MINSDLDILVSSHFDLLKEERELKGAIRANHYEVMKYLANKEMFDCFSVNWSKLRSFQQKRT